MSTHPLIEVVACYLLQTEVTLRQTPQTSVLAALPHVNAPWDDYLHPRLIGPCKEHQFQMELVPELESVLEVLYTVLYTCCPSAAISLEHGSNRDCARPHVPFQGLRWRTPVPYEADPGQSSNHTEHIFLTGLHTAHVDDLAHEPFGRAQCET